MGAWGPEGHSVAEMGHFHQLHMCKPRGAGPPPVLHAASLWGRSHLDTTSISSPSSWTRSQMSSAETSRNLPGASMGLSEGPKTLKIYQNTSLQWCHGGYLHSYSVTAHSLGASQRPK